MTAGNVNPARCAICGRPHDDPSFASGYKTMVCRDCDTRAVNSDGAEPEWSSQYDSGENPVFIDSIKCWRRYRFGGYITMRDRWDSDSLDEFYEHFFAEED